MNKSQKKKKKNCATQFRIRSLSIDRCGSIRMTTHTRNKCFRFTRRAFQHQYNTPRPRDCSRGTRARRLDHVELGFSFDDPAPAADPYRLLLITKQEQSISSLQKLGKLFPLFLQFCVRFPDFEEPRSWLQR